MGIVNNILVHPDLFLFIFIIFQATLLRKNILDS